MNPECPLEICPHLIQQHMIYVKHQPFTAEGERSVSFVSHVLRLRLRVTVNIIFLTWLCMLSATREKKKLHNMQNDT